MCLTHRMEKVCYFFFYSSAGQPRTDSAFFACLGATEMSTVCD